MSLAISGTSIRQDSNGRFCLNDLHKASGGEKRHQPANWLRTEQVVDLIGFLESEESKADFSVIESKQGLGTFVVKELVYSYAMWISAKFQITVIRAYDSLVSKPAYALRDLPPQTLTPAMKKHINQRVNYLVKHQVGASYASLGKLIQDAFNVNKRELILASKYPELCALLGCEPNPKALQGEIVETPKLEYQPPKGMALIPENELAEMKKRPTSTWSNYASMTLALPNDNNRMLVSMVNGITSLFEIPENYLIGNIESLTRQLKLEGYHVVKNDPQNKLETIGKIVSAQLVA
jgi:hypothetical protein